MVSGVGGEGAAGVLEGREGGGHGWEEGPKVDEDRGTEMGMREGKMVNSH
jgi:hypothetical protein